MIFLSKRATPGLCLVDGHLKTRPLFGRRCRREGSPLAKSFYTSQRQKGRPLRSAMWSQILFKVFLKIVSPSQGVETSNSLENTTGGQCQGQICLVTERSIKHL